MSEHSKWCMFRDSTELRAVLTYRLNLLRKRGETYSSIATKSGIQNKNLSKWVNGKRNAITQFDLLKLADYCGVSVELKVTLRELEV